MSVLCVFGHVLLNMRVFEYYVLHESCMKWSTVHEEPPELLSSLVVVLVLNGS